MSDLKRPMGTDVLTAARERIALVFDRFSRVYVSFSGGKDSTVMLHLVMDEAIKRGRKVGLLFIDLEAQYHLTIEHVHRCFEMYRDHIEPYWVCLPMSLRNAVSMHEPRWQCWDPDERERWVRELPEADGVISDDRFFPFFGRGMEFEEFVEEFGRWYGGDVATCCMVGIRADESLNRFRTLTMKKARLDGIRWTTFVTAPVFNAYPIYDWRTRDIWVYHAKNVRPHNRLYDLMHQAGLTISQMRICQPYGDDQRKGLWLYHIIEPETWAKVVKRVAGANFGASHVEQRGNILGNFHVTLPAGHSWSSFASFLIESLPPTHREHTREMVSIYCKQGLLHLPEDGDGPSWRLICKTILRNDYWGRTLGYSQEQREFTRRQRQARVERKRNPSHKVRMIERIIRGRL